MKTTLERAFELAGSGKYGSMDELQRALTAERYALNQLNGPALLNQLRTIMKAARAPEGKCRPDG